MINGRLLLTLGLFSVATLASGCYSYSAIERPTPGSQVRIHIPMRSAAASVGGTETVTFEGTVLAFSDSLVLETRSRREYGAFREVFEFDTLRVHPGSLSGIDERTYSKRKTYAFTALVTAGAAALVVGAVQAAGGGDGNGGPGNGVVLPAKILKPVLSSILRLVGR
jgi:hypothetical protein